VWRVPRRAFSGNQLRDARRMKSHAAYVRPEGTDQIQRKSKRIAADRFKKLVNK